MALNFTKFKQVRKDGELMFERDLYELSGILGRPAPEFEGTQLNVHVHGDLSWFIKSSVRGNIESPHSKTLTFTSIDDNWDDGLYHAMEKLLARLCETHKDELANSRFQFYGRRDSLGNPLPTRQHCDFGQHLEAMELLLHRTENQLRHSRMDCDLRDMQIADIKGELFDAQEELQNVQNQLLATQNKLKKSKDSRSRLARLKKKFLRSNDSRGKQLGDLHEKMEQKEFQVKGLEEKLERLRHEVEELMASGDSLMEGIDIEPEIPPQ